MKRNYIYNLILGVGVLFGTASCTDLDEDLIGEVTAPINIAKVSSGGGASGGANDLTVGAYIALRNAGNANHGGYFSVQSVSSDEMAIAQKGGDWFDGGIWLEMHRHTYTPGNGPLNGTWDQQYAAIGDINNAITSAAGNADAIAELKVIRALLHWRLLDLYGRIRYITEGGVASAQLSRTDGVTRIQDEILDALGITVADLANLDNATFGSDLSTSKVAYRVNRYAALGLLAKVYLNTEIYTGTGKYQEAHDIAEYIISNSGYNLHSNYAEIFAPDNNSNGASSELIWAVEYDEATAGGMNFAQMSLTYASQATWELQDQPWNGYAALEDFYNSYDDNDVRRENNLLEGPQRKWGDEGANTGDLIIDYAYDDRGTGADQGPVVNYKPGINELAPNGCRDCGTRLHKFSFKRLQRPEMDNDYPLVRLSEMYLIQAEAILRGATSGFLAHELLNAIRERAGLGGYAAADLDLEELFDERGREMFMEATRRQDQIRFGKWSDAWWEKGANASGDHPVMPIPQPAIDGSSGALTQNSQY